MTTLANNIEALAKDATPGPWETYSLDQGVQVWSGHGYLGETRDYTGNDAALIVELVNNLPTILSALRERDQAVEALQYIAYHQQKPTRDPYEAAARQPLIDIANQALATLEGTGHE